MELSISILLEQNLLFLPNGTPNVKDVMLHISFFQAAVVIIIMLDLDEKERNYFNYCP